ncbi:MAG: hypothetical protein Q8L66_13850 [Caulobacter sp.]|nr:hypothetical protein [Caulobacter sp.]
MNYYTLFISGILGESIIAPFYEKGDFDAFTHAKGFLSGLLYWEGSVPISLTADLRAEGDAPAFARCAVSAQDGLREPAWTFTPRTRSERLAGRDFSVADPHDEPPANVVGPSRMVRKKSIAARG